MGPTARLPLSSAPPRADGYDRPRPGVLLMTSLSTLDLESTLQETGSIRVALVPVGGIDGPTFRRLAGFIHPVVSLDLGCITHGQRRGTLNLRFVEVGAGISDWDDLYPHQRVRAVVGICHCPSERNLGRSFHTFMQKGTEGFPHMSQLRCFIFEPPESGVLAQDLPPSDLSRMVLVPPASDEIMSVHIERLLEDLGSELLRDLAAEAATLPTLPTTPLDANGATDRSTVSRLLGAVSSRLTGRQQKRKADYALLYGDTAKAKAAYERAIETLSRSGADVVWHAAALEGSSAATLIHLARLIRDHGGSTAAGSHGGLAAGSGDFRGAASSSSGLAAGARLVVPAADDAEGVALADAYDEALAVARRRLEEGATLCAARGGRSIEVAVEMGFRLARLVGETAERERSKLAAQAHDHLMPTEHGELPPPPSAWRYRLIEAAGRVSH